MESFCAYAISPGEEQNIGFTHSILFPPGAFYQLDHQTFVPNRTLEAACRHCHSEMSAYLRCWMNS